MTFTPDDDVIRQMYDRIDAYLSELATFVSRAHPDADRDELIAALRIEHRGGPGHALTLDADIVRQVADLIINQRGTSEPIRPASRRRNPRTRGATAGGSADAH